MPGHQLAIDPGPYEKDSFDESFQKKVYEEVLAHPFEEFPCLWHVQRSVWRGILPPDFPTRFL